jgi:hypothetical protein
MLWGVGEDSASSGTLVHSVLINMPGVFGAQRYDLYKVDLRL